MDNDWLAQLAPERAPLTPLWWPPAPGWWVLALLLLATIVGGIIWWRLPRRRLRRVALRELRRLQSFDADIPHTARTVQNLLRRYALAAFGPDRVARLSGEAWLQFIAARGAAILGGSLGKSLLAASFGARTTDRQWQDRDAWCAAAEQFLRRAVQHDQRGGRK
jgi:Domain of unknown function (DUF4381)